MSFFLSLYPSIFISRSDTYLPDESNFSHSILSWSLWNLACNHIIVVSSWARLHYTSCNNALAKSVILMWINLQSHYHFIKRNSFFTHYIKNSFWGFSTYNMQFSSGVSVFFQFTYDKNLDLNRFRTKHSLHAT